MSYFVFEKWIIFSYKNYWPLIFHQISIQISINLLISYDIIIAVNMIPYHETCVVI